MSLKLGRVAAIPMDSLSFGNYHKAIRETLMMDSRRWRRAMGVEQPEAPSPAPVEPLTENATTREIASHQAQLDQYREAVAALSREDKALHEEELARYEQEASLFRKIDDLTIPQLIDYLFLSAVQRRATEAEQNALSDIFLEGGHLDEDFDNVFARSGRQDEIALITMDYLSRLPELYYMPSLR